MIITATSIAGVFTVDAERHTDERGSFTAIFSRDAFAAHGIDTAVAQTALSTNPKRGTLRGLHYQLPPRAEVKLVRCARGAAFDVVVDLRPGSPTCASWLGFELTAEGNRAVSVPKGCAHGFLTLADDTHIAYQMSEPYDAALARGVRWDDPAFGIAWPFAPIVMNERDRSWADFAVESR